MCYVVKVYTVNARNMWTFGPEPGLSAIGSDQSGHKGHVAMCGATTFPTTSHTNTWLRSRGLTLKDILLIQQCIADALVIGPAANFRRVGEEVLLDKLAVDAG